MEKIILTLLLLAFLGYMFYTKMSEDKQKSVKKQQDKPASLNSMRTSPSYLDMIYRM